MTDGQSFYLVLTLFYLLECVKFAPPKSLGLVSRIGRFGACAPRPQLMMAWGIKKSVFVAPFLPWPAIMYIISGYTDADHSSKRLKTASAIRHHHRFLKRATNKLRSLAILNLLNFFLVLPIVYTRTYDEFAILYCLAYSYAVLLLTAIHFHALHKRLFPTHKADRLKATLYTALLPWHAPRAADEIYLKASSQWSPLAALAANTHHPATLDLLQRHWRKAHFQPQPNYTATTLSAVLARAQIDPGTWLQAPSDLDSPKYCPCCHNGYEAIATHCADCQGIPLKKK
ncbi:hypothetical protein VDG1235_3529 [Verrucomicrobiia bacterium DG1235]|nr:hypothetical protein VDG1235_3529 [Verrucomicrobiae bacterium DG1235]